jgi:hypothetical protein
MGKYSLKEFEALSESGPDMNMSMEDLDAIGELRAHDVHRRTTPLRLQDMPADVLRHISSFNPPTYTFSTTQARPRSVWNLTGDNLTGAWVRNHDDSLVGAYELLTGERTYRNLPFVSNPGLNVSRDGGFNSGDRVQRIDHRLAADLRMGQRKSDIKGIIGRKQGEPSLTKPYPPLNTRIGDEMDDMDMAMLGLGPFNTPPGRDSAGYNR